MKRLLIITLFILSLVTPVHADYMSDLIMTGTTGIWTDSRAYSTLADCIADVGAIETDIYIAKQEAVTVLTIPATARLHFLKSGSIANTGQLTLNTKQIFAGDQQIFTGTGDIDFSNGTVVRSSWFSTIVTAFTLTNDDNVTLVISKPAFITANCAVGDNVNLRWESPRTQLTANAGFTLSNIKNIEAGNFQLFAGAGTFTFLDGSRLKLSWFARLRSAITWINTTEATLVVSGTNTVDYSDTVPYNLTLDMSSENGIFSVSPGITLTINGHFIAGMRQAFTTTGTIIFASGSVEKINVRWSGAVGDGTTDDSTEINYVANSGRLNAVPIYFPTGNYYVTVSLNFSGASNDNAGYSDGWTVYGDGPEATQIYGDLALAYPIIDMVDNAMSVLKDMRIEGKSTGSQICGVLHGEVATNVSADNKIINVAISGTFAESAYINMGADLTTLRDSFFNGPCGVIFTTTKDAIAGNVIASAYQTLDTAGEGTHQRIESCHIWGAGGDTNNWDSAVVSDETYKVVIFNTYIAQTTMAKAGIIVDGANGTSYDHHTIDFIGSRYENQTSPTAAGTFIWVVSADGLADSYIDGFAGGLGIPDTGQMIYLGGGSLYTSKIRLESGGAAEWTHTVTRSAAETIDYSQIHEMVASTQLKSADAACFGTGNIFYLFAWNAAWTGVGEHNIFYTYDKGMITIGSSSGLNSIGTTSSLARTFTGLVEATYQATVTTAAAGDETLDSYTLPGDLGLSNSIQNLSTLRVKAFGYVAANANAKTIEGKFGVGGSETSIITNDITGSPNNVKWETSCEIIRIDSVTGWIYNCTMTVGAVTQTNTVGIVLADPDADTVNFLVTGDAGLNEIALQMFKVEIF